MINPIRIGTRGSQLALWQANHIAAALRVAGHAVEIEVIRTTGDRMSAPGYVAPASPGPADGKGIFIKEIAEALAEGRIDVAVHSLKDLPTELDPRFLLAAIPARADARDVWVCEQFWALHTLPMGGRIGTTSPRRQAQLLALRPDVTFVEIKGNIDTRLRKLDEGQCDALVLAAAGLDRLDRAESVHQRFDIDQLCPAPGQGALALEMRAANHPADLACDHAPAIRRAIAALDDATTRLCVTAERVVLHSLGGGCQLPIGVYCSPAAFGFHLHAQVVAPDGESMIHLNTQAAADVDPIALGHSVAEELTARGALDLLG
jgi:hydroxymethylbilane synthase